MINKDSFKEKCCRIFRGKKKISSLKNKLITYQKRINSLFGNELIKVYSHPRSGTHLLEAFLAVNFYKDKDLFVKDVLWGHWSNRKKREEGNKYGKLFGSHEFPGQWLAGIFSPVIYIYRDGRDVAYSVWKTPNFLNKRDSDLDFGDFLDIKIDWEGTPGKKAFPKENIVQHWERHVLEWKKIKKRNLLIIRYEKLVKYPEEVYIDIIRKFFPLKYILYFLKIYKPEIAKIDGLVGLKPNKGMVKGWKLNFSDIEKQKFLSKLKHKNLLNE